MKPSDAKLLCRYLRKRSEGDFAELVGRHIDLVYSTALRQLGGDQELARDVAQSVFVDLARKAESLIGRSSLTGWLYTSARFAAVNLLRSEQRRHLREQKTDHMNQTQPPADVAVSWDKIRPVLDEAMEELPEPDREARSRLRHSSRSPDRQTRVS